MRKEEKGEDNRGEEKEKTTEGGRRREKTRKEGSHAPYTFFWSCMIKNGS